MHAALSQSARLFGGQVLTNGRYATLLTASGTGCAMLGEWALTRWNADPLEDSDGFFLYLRDLDSGVFWSLGQQPVTGSAERRPGRFGPSLIELLCRHEDIDAGLEVCVPTEVDAELRRVTLRNLSDRPRRIELSSYIEVVLNDWTADAAHPAFSKLFVQTEWVEEAPALLARRRPRVPLEPECWLIHAWIGEQATADSPSVSSREMGQEPELQYETDRARFIGRGYTLAAPRALLETTPLSGMVGNVLDPILSLRRTVVLAPGEQARLSFLLGAASTRESALALATRHTSVSAVERAFQAATHSDEAACSRQIAAQALSPPPLPPAVEALPSPFDEEESLQFWNGLGGFSADGTEYVIRLRPDADGRLRLPPRPWINVIANPEFGFFTSERGAGCTWSQNSRENRLTPWYNDPVLDPHGEVLYLRDEESGAFWSLTPGPIPQAVPYEVRHGFGYSRYRHFSQGLEQSVCLFASHENPVKIARIQLRNLGNQPRRLSLFAYTRLVLGVLPGTARTRIERDAAAGILLAENRNREFSGRITFAAVAPLDSIPLYFTGDRAEFIGRHGNPACPAALVRSRILSGRLSSDFDPCFVLQTTIQLEPGATLEQSFLLGEAGGRDEVRRLVARYREDGAIAKALTEAQEFWKNWLAAIQIRTPEPALDVLINGWAAYQTRSCRLWGRSAFYQSGGAFGFRDQLQDAAALIHHDPELTRRQLLLHAAHQFVEGDVLHWWHPPLSRGVRTRCSDDLLWLPYLTAFYARTTGDWSLFGEPLPFLKARTLEPGEDEAFLEPEQAEEVASLYQHCCRALDRSLTQGVHGLPLMGGGDWNDGMNRVGRAGRGESVWLGFFLYHILGEFVGVCGQRGDHNRARRYAAFRRHLAEALNREGWDGQWYRRAWYDNGAVLGSATSDECRIDALAQAWAVIAKAAPLARAEAALEAVDRCLISEKDGLIRLLTPPFEQTPHDPGYIKAYVAGVRENGGQYTHAALWVVQALAELGQRDRAVKLLKMLSPIHHTQTPEAVARYQLEPFVVAADVYGAPPHVGRGGWSWYTGSSGWLLRVMLESILGLELIEGHSLGLRPRIPDDWLGFHLRYRLPDNEAVYEIEVCNPNRRAAQVVAVEIDDRPGVIDGGAARVPLFRDGNTHQVVVKLDRNLSLETPGESA